MINDNYLFLPQVIACLLIVCIVTPFLFLTEVKNRRIDYDVQLINKKLNNNMTKYMTGIMQNNNNDNITNFSELNSEGILSIISDTPFKNYIYVIQKIETKKKYNKYKIFYDPSNTKFVSQIIFKNNNINEIINCFDDKINLDYLAENNFIYNNIITTPEGDIYCYKYYGIKNNITLTKINELNHITENMNIKIYKFEQGDVCQAKKNIESRKYCKNKMITRWGIRIGLYIMLFSGIILLLESTNYINLLPDSNTNLIPYIDIIKPLVTTFGNYIVDIYNMMNYYGVSLLTLLLGLAVYFVVNQWILSIFIIVLIVLLAQYPRYKKNL